MNEKLYEKLKKRGACNEGLDYLKTLEIEEPEEIFQHYLKEKKYQELAYGIAFLMTKKQRVKWSIFSAESCLENYEKAFPNDDRPRLAIEATKEYLKNPCEKTRSAAGSAVRSAVRSAWSADAAGSAADAARSAADAAWSAWSARSADAAESAAWSAAWSAGSAGSATWEILLKKGYEILAVPGILQDREENGDKKI